VAEAAAALDSFGASDLRCVDLAETLARRYVASNGGLRIDDLDGGLNVRRIRDAFHG
jgi:hypothetical protein